MSAALLLNPLLGAAPVDPARPLSSGDGGFAGVLADATAAVAETGGDPANAPAGTAAPAVAPAPAKAAVISSLLTAAAGEGLTTPADLAAADGPTPPGAGLAPVAAVPTPAAATPSLWPDLPAAADLPVADGGDGEPPAADAPAPGAQIQTLVQPLGHAAVQALAPTTAPASNVQAASAPLVAEAAPTPGASAGLSAAGPAGPTTAAPVEGLPASTVSLSAEAPVGTTAQGPGANEVPVGGDAVARLAIAPANSGDAAALSRGVSPAVAGATASPASPDAAPAGVANAAVTGGQPAALAEAPAPAASSPAATVPEGLTTSASAAPGAAMVADARGVPAATGAVQAQLAAAGAALATKPTARRTDAPAAAEALQSTLALAPGGGPDSAELAVEPEPSTPVTSSGGTLALNGQAGAAASPPQGAAAGAPAQTAGAAAATAEATPAAVLAEADVELVSLEAPTDLPAGEAARLPETPLPTASSLVLQPMVNDGRFNAVAQISAQILRRLEGQTTRFELALTPEDLGRVDVMLEIDGDGAVTARLAFDNPAAAAELRAQADQLRRELEAAGLNVGRDGLQFAERDARRDDSGSDRRGAKAFAGAARLEADADAGVAAYRMTTADGRLDVRI